MSLPEPSLIQYVVYYLQEEIDRGYHANATERTIKNLVDMAIEAYEGGAR